MQPRRVTRRAVVHRVVTRSIKEEPAYTGRHAEGRVVTHPPMNSAPVENSGRGLLFRVLFRVLAFPVIFVALLVGMFLFAARWAIYFCAALLATVFALGSKRYMNYFPLAFMAPLFIGGLIDGVILLATERRGRQRGG